MDFNIYTGEYNIEDTELEFINFDEWLLESNQLEYRLNSSGFNLEDNTLSVRNFKYHNRIYAFEIDCIQSSHDYTEVTLKIEEDGIIDSYCLGILNNFTIGLLKNIFKYSSLGIYKDNNTEVKYAIIEYLNILIDNINGFELLRYNKDGTCAKFFNHFDNYDPCRCNEYLYFDKSFFPTSFNIDYVIHTSEKYDNLIKLTNTKTGHVTYGIRKTRDDDSNFDPDDEKYKYNCELFCLDLDTADKILTYRRGFYPFYILYKQRFLQDDTYKDILISKASLDELNERQLIKYKKMIGIN